MRERTVGQCLDPRRHNEGSALRAAPALTPGGRTAFYLENGVHGSGGRKGRTSSVSVRARLKNSVKQCQTMKGETPGQPANHLVGGRRDALHTAEVGGSSPLAPTRKTRESKGQDAKRQETPAQGATAGRGSPATGRGHPQNEDGHAGGAGTTGSQSAGEGAREGGGGRRSGGGGGGRSPARCGRPTVGAPRPVKCGARSAVERRCLSSGAARPIGRHAGGPVG